MIAREIILEAVYNRNEERTKANVHIEFEETADIFSFRTSHKESKSKFIESIFNNIAWSLSRKCLSNSNNCSNEPIS